MGVLSAELVFFHRFVDFLVCSSRFELLVGVVLGEDVGWGSLEGAACFIGGGAVEVVVFVDFVGLVVYACNMQIVDSNHLL